MCMLHELEPTAINLNNDDDDDDDNDGGCESHLAIV